MAEFDRYIIDERGTFRVLGDDFRKFIGSKRSDEDLASYCVDKLGYIVVECRANNIVFASFSERVVGPIALISLMQWLHERPTARFVFNQGGINTAPNLVPSLRHARQRLSELVQASAPMSSFEVTNLAPEASPFAKVWQVAQEIHTAEMPERMRVRLLDKLFEGRFTLSERDDANGDFTIKAVGSALLPHQFTEQDRYTTFRDMHDREYGKWIADGLKQLAPVDQPIFQLVSAPLKFPELENRVLHRYSRLLFAPRIGGTQRLLTASVVC